MAGTQKKNKTNANWQHPDKDKQDQQATYYRLAKNFRTEILRSTEKKLLQAS
jgi:hypothetical protein